VKYVPEWMPGAGFKKKAKAWKKAVLEMRDVPFDVVTKWVVSIFFVLCSRGDFMKRSL
jgi:hypothetical protein